MKETRSRTMVKKIYLRNNSTPEDYLFLLGFIALAATLVMSVMLLNSNLLSVTTFIISTLR